jgi:hypothetical protein
MARKPKNFIQYQVHTVFYAIYPLLLETNLSENSSAKTEIHQIDTMGGRSSRSESLSSSAAMEKK